ncbi:unnamed protein product [Parajaminaea phylloscopi]
MAGIFQATGVHQASPGPLQAFLQHPYVAPIAGNPLNLALLAVLAYLLVPLFSPASPAKLTPTVEGARQLSASDAYNYLPKEHPPCIEWKQYTPRTLAIHDGTGGGDPSAATPPAGGRILLSINRKVFDVTSGARFYGPGGPYGNFAGRDASRGMAKQSFDIEMLTPLKKAIDDLSDLTQVERTNMKEWDAHFTAKYPVVGELIDENP